MNKAPFFISWLGGRRKLEQTARDADRSASELREKARLAAEEKDRLLSVLGSMAEGVLVIGADERVLLVNPGFMRAFRSRREDTEGRFFWEVFRDPEINTMIRRALTGRETLSREHTPLLSDSVFRIQVSPVSSGQEFLGAVAVFHDVTQLKELERMRTEFVANVSHELKTPLTAILGFVETLKEGAAEDPETRSKFLQVIETHARKLHDLIEGLLLLSKVESGQSPLKKETFDLEGAVEKILDVLDRAMAAKKIRVIRSIEPRPFLVTADPKLMGQVLLNLIDNAVKYNRDGGRITVRAESAVSEVRIEVADTGVGIPESDLSRVFERFYRVDKSRSRETGGTGLGLSITKHIVEAHGGTIRVESVPGKGSRFTVVLPQLHSDTTH